MLITEIDSCKIGIDVHGETPEGEWMFHEKKYILLTVMILSVGLMGCDGVREATEISAVQTGTPDEKNGQQTELQTRQSKIFVHIAGAVKSPGVYELDENARLYQLVEIAGGMTKKAQKDSVNLAEKLTDGQMVLILTKNEYQKQRADPEGKAEQSSQTNGLLDINLATVEELMGLSGIGETKAKAIIAYRDENGAFQTIEDIKKVSGIGEATFNNIKSEITVH